MTEQSLFIVNISHREILAGDTGPFLAKMEPFTEDPKPEYAKNFLFGVDGYNDRPEEVYTFQEVRDYYKKLDAEWPFALFFSSIEFENVVNIAFSVVDGITARTELNSPRSSVCFDQKILADWILSRFAAMNHLYEKAYGGPTNDCEVAIRKHTDEIMQLFFQLN
jgi:hypothetical protein